MQLLPTVPTRDEAHEAIVAAPYGVPIEYVLGIDPISKSDWQAVEGMLAE